MFNTLYSKFIFASKSIVFTPIIWFIETYVWTDWNLLISISLLILLDGVVLGFKALIRKDYDAAKGLRDFGLKTFGIAITIAGVGVLDNAMIRNDSVEALQAINYGFYTMILAFLFISLLTNIYKIYPIEPIRKMIERLNKIFE